MISSPPVWPRLRPAFSGGVAGLIAQRPGGPLRPGAPAPVFSLVSWAIILYKGLVLHRAHSQSDTFLEVFRKSSKFSEVNSVCSQLKASPLVGVFQAGYLEVNQQVRGTGARARGRRQAHRAEPRVALALARPRGGGRGRRASSGA